MGFDYSKVEKLIGKESGAIPALDVVSKSDIRHWLEMIHEDHRHFMKIDWKETCAPPAMIIVWTQPPLWSPEPKEPTEPHELAMKALDEAGYDCAIGIEMDQEFFTPVKVNDKLSYTVKLKGISKSEVETKTGSGYKVDLQYTISNQNGKLVSKQDYTLLKMKDLRPAVK